MCRTNRLYSASKQHGLIIDYLGVFENLAKALAYDPEEINTTCEALDNYKQQLPLALEKCLAFFAGTDRSIGGYEGLIAAQAMPRQQRSPRPICRPIQHPRQALGSANPRRFSATLPARLPLARASLRLNTTCWWFRLAHLASARPRYHSPHPPAHRYRPHPHRL